MFLKNMFKKQTRFQKYLFESTIYDNSETVDLEDIKKMLQGYPSKEEEDQLVQSMTIVQVFKEFIRLIPQQLESPKKLKVLLTIHVLMGDIKHGRLFVQQFLGWIGWQHMEQKDTFSKFSSVQTMIIQKLALISEIISKSKMKSNSNVVFKDIDSNVMQFYKMINALNLILGQHEFYAQVFQTHNRTIVMEIYLLLWNDVIALYLMLESQQVYCYQQMDQQQSIQVYELFNEYIKLTPQVKKFAQLRVFFQNCIVNEPKWYQPTKKEIEELQIYFQNVKIYLTSRSKRLKIEKSSPQPNKNGQTSGRDMKKSQSQSQIIPKGDLKQQQDHYLSNTTMDCGKRIHQGNAASQAQYTFESECQTGDVIKQ
ncbi:unnamed protein product (macronuclear) [Paramecium tetraurelia]|uniref:AP180 N-terminal homology (ANTH) domain-containing protein n=1 Tax=Paramecium tetraurelia TaxID=5888 RepID=A0EGR8_PARTE|nr:uncharacterized protein GSPATT00026833001 [Paramecium tetraurelia]CAK94509.1 unnamed protein product [Paramecium tetraurelia]|eukprot:XP_001461882.1 hypothetical protein (macronuclear) [Paramecium tetraurelia strain d4-2]